MTTIMGGRVSGKPNASATNAQLLCQLLPEHLQLDPRLRRSVRSNDLAVQLTRSNLVSHKRSFVPSATRIWNSLPE